MFKKIIKGFEKITGTRIFTQTKFNRLQTKIEELHKMFPPTPTTRIEIKAQRDRNQRELNEMNEKFSRDQKDLNNKYKSLEEDLVIAGMEREIKIRQNSNAARFSVQITK